MNFDQYRMKPLPPQKKPIWKILAFGVIAILLIFMITFAFLNPRILCEKTGGKWLTYSEVRAQQDRGFVNYDTLSEEQNEYFGTCFR